MTAPLRVLHVITDLRVGGAETMLAKLLGAMDRERFPSEVASLVGGGEVAGRIRDLGVPVTELGLRPGRPDPRALWRLRRVLGRFGPAVVQGWMYHGNLAATLACWGLRPAPRVLWNIRHALHDLAGEAPLTRRVIGLSARLSGRPAAIVYNAEVSRRQHEAVGYAGAHARVLPNGFDLDRFRPAPEARAGLRRDLGLPPDAPLVGLVARYHEVKGHDVFLEAMALARRSLPDLHGVCVGRGVTEEQSGLAVRVGREDLAGHVHLLDPREDTAPLLAALDVLVSASRSEGFPNVLGEALACGTPCVATDVGESRIILEGVGEVVPPGDAEALAEGLLRLLNEDPAAREERSRRGRERVAERYTLPVIARLYEDLYANPWIEGDGSA